MTATASKPRKTYHGEEAQKVTWRDEQAANLAIARMKADPSAYLDFLVEAPRTVLAVVQK